MPSGRKGRAKRARKASRFYLKRLYIAGAYSIADMACYPWIVAHDRQGQRLADFPHIQRWFHQIQSRPAVQQAYEKGSALTAAR